MYIEPNTKIIFLRNCPLDVEYENTYLYSTPTEQYNYFYSLKKFELNGQSYNRVRRGVSRVQIKAEDLYDCNYMMFQNSSFGDKWFYAFITGVEYVSNIVSEVSFEIDDIQTWLFNITLKDSFVERQHSESDLIGDNLVVEPLATSEYVFDNYDYLLDTRDMMVIIAIVDVDEISGKVYDGIYGGCTLFAYESTDITGINEKLQQYQQKPESIINMYMCPKAIVPTTPDDKHIPNRNSAVGYVVQKQPITLDDTFGEYLPKNKKLYTYPYNYFNVDNGSGNNLALRYEFFDNLTPVMSIKGTITNPVRMLARPCSYKGVPSYTELGGYHELFTESIMLENYPTCSWNNDTYKTWVAQNSVPIALNTISTGASIIGGNYASSLRNRHNVHPVTSQHVANIQSNINTVDSITSILSNAYSASIAADTCRGNINNGGVNVAHRDQVFRCGRCRIIEEHCKIIDNFFTKYGYAQNKIFTPNLSARPYYTYIKTNGCNIVGSCPSDSIGRIKAIFDNGITFWKSGSVIGDYSVDNSPT